MAEKLTHLETILKTAEIKNKVENNTGSLRMPVSKAILRAYSESSHMIAERIWQNRKSLYMGDGTEQTFRKTFIC